VYCEGSHAVRGENTGPSTLKDPYPKLIVAVGFCCRKCSWKLACTPVTTIARN